MSREDKERLDNENVVIHRMPHGLDYNDHMTYFPVNDVQVRDLIGKILTQIESMNLKDQTESAAKAIFKQIVWRWWDDAMDNSVSSANGCISPIKLPPQELPTK